MKRNNLLASMAGKALALAVVMMMSVAFTACNKDNGKEPEPVTISNSVTIDGKVMPVLSAEYETFSSSQDVFKLYLNVSEDGKTYVMINGSTALHIGKDFNLTTKEPKGQDDYWGVGYWDADINDWLFQTNGDPKFGNPPFTTGTLRMDGDPMGGEVSVNLKNGKITDATNGDGKEHTISINWKGKAKKL